MIDYKKTQKELYHPKTEPTIIDVPEMPFIMIDGRGNPNTSEAYLESLEILYGLSYSIKMSKLGGAAPEGYYDFVVPPLEGLWWVQSGDRLDFSDKDKYFWTSMIRQPEFVTQDVFEDVKKAFSEKKPYLDLTPARLELLTEGLCVQIMHIGPYDDEPATIEIMDKYLADSGYVSDISETRHHHEIYLSDPRRTAQKKLKTIIRHPIRKAE